VRQFGNEVNVIEYDNMGSLTHGAYFGECAILFNSHRSATVSCADYGMYGSIFTEDLEYLISIEPGIRNMMTK
jgi:CRP-like cAMP-binding protein